MTAGLASTAQTDQGGVIGLGGVVADAMVTVARTSHRAATVQEVCAEFDDDHVHAVLVVDDGVLITVIDRADLSPHKAADGASGTGGRADEVRAEQLGTLVDRVIAPQTPLDSARRTMLRLGRRRLAVVDRDGTYRGLLCLKRTGNGFCSDSDVRARAQQTSS